LTSLAEWDFLICRKEAEMKSKRTGFWMVMAFAALLASGTTELDAAQAGDGVFIHISHGKDDPHRVLMALNMATMMSEDHDVLVYFDIRGVEVVLKDAEDITYSHFPSSKTQLSALLGKGVSLLACPGCLEAAGKTPDDLAAGIKVADKAAFFSFTKGRILTLDY
jgi:predicted peroxiredoxin